MIDPLLGELNPTGTNVFRFGDIVRTAGGLRLRLDGVIQSARWSQTYFPVAGDPVLVVTTSGATGQSSHLVLCKAGAAPGVAPPAEGTVTATPAGSATITISAGGVSYNVKKVGPTPAIGDLVLLAWRGEQGYAAGVITATPPAAPPPVSPGPTAPPGGATSGTLGVPAIDSGTYNVGQEWNDRTFGTDVVQGSYGGRTSTGAWFYGTAAAQLSGRSLGDVRIKLPPRRRMGSYNAPLTLHFYAHTSPSRPGGEPVRVAGPADVTLPKGHPGGWFGLPREFGPIVVAGGGLAIAGDPYGGVLGRSAANPDSGALEIDWAG